MKSKSHGYTLEETRPYHAVSSVVTVPNYRYAVSSWRD